MSKTTRIRQQTWTAPVVAANTGVHAAVTLPSTGTTEVTTEITNPATPRTIRLKGNQSSTQGLAVIIEGTDIFDQPITDTVTLGNDYTSPTDSNKAFKTVTKITVPTRGASSDTISFGPGAALALDCYCDKYSFKGISGVTSFSYDDDEISKNHVTLSATLNGSDDQGIIYVPLYFPSGLKIS